MRQRQLIAAQVRPGLLQAVSAELLQAGIGEDDSQHRLGDYPCGGDDADIAALIVGFSLPARPQIN